MPTLLCHRCRRTNWQPPRRPMPAFAACSTCRALLSVRAATIYAGSPASVWTAEALALLDGGALLG